jgi:hypothetical protein
MPVKKISDEFKMETRDRYTKVDTVVTISVDGPELPNSAVLGEALDKAIEIVRESIKQSYVKVPERDGGTPVAKVYEKPAGALFDESN